MGHSVRSRQFSANKASAKSIAPEIESKPRNLTLSRDLAHFQCEQTCEQTASKLRANLHVDAISAKLASRAYSRYLH